ncbi:gp166 [Sphingomonas phage PAU]|uniref:gp166 n=1 Tax=Sphingomonas phage PAU TaxID=1150991 RepID=UPI00025732F2|nr:gp166 [Sphingomonas phage PAU]AFF28164.1 gp166 [Sphingomonas phage PAU]
MKTLKSMFESIIKDDMSPIYDKAKDKSYNKKTNDNSEMSPTYDKVKAGKNKSDDYEMSPTK